MSEGWWSSEGMSPETNESFFDILLALLLWLWLVRTASMEYCDDERNDDMRDRYRCQRVRPPCCVVVVVIVLLWWLSGK